MKTLFLLLWTTVLALNLYNVIGIKGVSLAAACVCFCGLLETFRMSDKK